MCIAITKPASTKPDWEAYANGFKANPDGWGFAVPHDGKVLIRKDLSPFADFRKAFEPYADRDALVHFRIKSAGDISKRNCHPFRISNGMAMVHNGTIPIACNLVQSKSDTWHFVKQVLRPMHESDPRFCWNPGSQFIAEQYLGHNKLAFITDGGEFCVWNEHLGVKTKDGHWYSNTTYQDRGSYFSHSTSYYSHGSSGKKSKTKSQSHANKSIFSEDDWYYSDTVRERLWEMDDGRYTDDPIVKMLGTGATLEDYENAQGCLAHGLSDGLVADMYAEDPDLLETVAYYHEPRQLR